MFNVDGLAYAIAAPQGFLIMNTDLKTTGFVLFLTEIKPSKIHSQEHRIVKNR